MGIGALALFLTTFTTLGQSQGFVRYYENITDLKAVNNVGNYNLFVVAGSSVQDDGFGGVYTYVSGSSETANDDTVLAPDTLGGRFVLVDRNRIFDAQSIPTFVGSLAALANSNFATNAVAMVTVTNNPPVLGDPVLGNYLLTRPAIINTNAEDPNDLIQSTVDTTVVWHLADSVDQSEEITFATLSDVDLIDTYEGGNFVFDGTNIANMTTVFTAIAPTNGTTSASAALQAYLDDTAAQKMRLFIPAGNYLLTTGLEFNDNLDVVASPNARFIRGYDGDKFTDNGPLLSVAGHGYTIPGTNSILATNVSWIGGTFVTPYAWSGTNSRYVEFEATGSRITDMSLNFTNLGFQPGWKLFVKHTASNDPDTYYTIATVGSTNLTVNEALVNETITDHVMLKAAEFTGPNVATLWTDGWRLKDIQFDGVFRDWNTMLGGAHGLASGLRIRGSHVTFEDGAHVYMGEDIVVVDNDVMSGDDAFVAGNSHGYEIKRIKFANSVGHSLNGNLVRAVSGRSTTYTNVTTAISDVSFSDISGSWSFGGINAYDGHDSESLSGLSFRNITADWNGIIPTTWGYGVFLYWVAGATFENVNIMSSYRNPFWLYDSSNITVDGFKYGWSGSASNWDDLSVDGGSNIALRNIIANSTKNGFRVRLSGVNKASVSDSRLENIFNAVSGVFVGGGTLALNNYPSAGSTPYYWLLSSSGTSEYYLKLDTGIAPTFQEPATMLQVTNVLMTRGVAGTLATNEWDWADNDGLGWDTVYVRTDGSADPDDLTRDYINMTTRWTDVRTHRNYYTFGSTNATDYGNRFNAAVGDNAISTENFFKSPHLAGNDIFGGTLTNYVFKDNIGDPYEGVGDEIWIGADSFANGLGSSALVDVASRSSAWSLDTTSDESIHASFPVPKNWPDLSRVRVEVYASDVSGIGGSGQTVQLQWSMQSVSAGDLLSVSATGTSENFSMGNTQYELQKFTFSNIQTITNTHSMHQGLLTRDVSEDDYDQDVNIEGVKLIRVQ